MIKMSLTLFDLAKAFANNWDVMLSDNGLITCQDDRNYNDSNIDGTFKIISLTKNRVQLENSKGYILDDLEFSEIKLVVRDIHDIVKPIIFNNEEFTPIYEFVKMQISNMHFERLKYKEVFAQSNCSFIDFQYEGQTEGYSRLLYNVHEHSFKFFTLDNNKQIIKTHPVMDQLEMFKLLDKWEFDTLDIVTTQYISVKKEA